MEIKILIGITILWSSLVAGISALICTVFRDRGNTTPEKTNDMRDTNKVKLEELRVGSHCLYNGEVVRIMCVGVDICITENPVTHERITHVAPNIGPFSDIPITPEVMAAFGFKEGCRPTDTGCWYYQGRDELCVIPKGKGSAYVRFGSSTVIGNPTFSHCNIYSIHELENVIMVCLGETLDDPKQPINNLKV